MIIHSFAPSILSRRGKKNCVKVEDTIQELPTSAFSGNQLLMEVSLPETLRVIGPEAFLNCVLLSKIRIPVNVQEIRVRAFKGCQNLRDFALPSGLTCIQEETFSRCSKLKTMLVPCSVVVIEQGAFAYCTALLSVELSKGLQVIESRVFAHCEKLKNIEIPSTGNKVGDDAFVKCGRIMEAWLATRKRRFDDLPIHEMCYSQANHRLATNQKRLDRAIQMDRTSSRRKAGRSLGTLSLFRKNEALPTKEVNFDSLDLLFRSRDGCFVDSFDMTPLHVLALSARPCPSICKTLLIHYPSDVTSRDRYGKTPIDYACMVDAPIPVVQALLRTQRQRRNSFQDEEQLRCRYYISLTNRYDSMELLLYFTQRYFKSRMKSLRLDLRWQQDVLNETEKLSTLPNDIQRTEHLRRLDFIVTEYERKENLSLLELALWKGRLKSASPLRLHNPSWRKTCQIKCGADIVLPLVLPYLNDAEHSTCKRC